MTTKRSLLLFQMTGSVLSFSVYLAIVSLQSKFSSLNQQKATLSFQVLSVSFVSDCQTDIDLPSSCVIAGVDRKAGVETRSQRVEAGWTVYDCSFGGKPQLCWVKFCVMLHPRDGAFQYAFVQAAAAAKKAASFRQSQAKHWHLPLLHQ